MLWINFLGLALIGFIAWWFWFYRPDSVKAQAGQVPVIEVKDGIYNPSRLEVPQGQVIQLRFLRKDASPCAAVVQFPDFGISEDLPVNKAKTITLPAMLPGEYPFHCQMNMYQGQLVVK